VLRWLSSLISQRAESFDDQLQAVVAAAHSPAYVDLSGVSFIDSRGVKALAAASQSATQAGVNLVLVKPSRQSTRGARNN
jgi:anti-anti-sigma factor